MKRAAGLLAALLAVGCGDAVRSLAPTNGDAAHQTSELIGALAARFGPIDRTPEFDEVRPRLLRASLVPSQVYGDAAIWSEIDGEGRVVRFSGAPAEGVYRIGMGATTSPQHAADYRGELALAGEGEGAFEWKFREDLAVGRVSLAGLSAAAETLLRVPEGLGPGEHASRLRENLPRAAAALGRLVHLVSIRVERHGATAAVRLVADVVPASLGPRFRRYARYLERYAADTELHIEVRDALGLFWELDYRGLRCTLRFAVAGGSLAPLEAAQRRLPERLVVRTGFAMKSGRFTIGYRELHADVTLSADAASAGFDARFLREPEWRLPPLAGPLLRSPLRHPFDNPGSALAMRFEETPQTSLVVRDYRLRVRENWLIRWLGGRVGSAVDEFREGAESEADRFSAEALLALRDDLVALAGESPEDPTLSAGS